MNQIYEKNIDALTERYPELAKEIVKRNQENNQLVIQSEEAKDGTVILKVKKNDRILYLNGKYGAKLAIYKWFTDLGKIHYESTIVILGFGNGMYIRKLIENTPKSVRILVYEPCISIFLKAMEEIDLSQIFNNRPVGIAFHEINEQEFMYMVRNSINYDNLRDVKVMIHPNYDELFPEIILEYTKQIQKCMSNITVATNTELRYTSGMVKNVLNNVKYIPGNYNVEQLYGTVPKDLPGIVVSAGPSLNKNIKELKKAKNKAFIIATDTSLKPLIREGVIPDVFIVIDGLKPITLFNMPEISKIPIVAPVCAASEVLKSHTGKKFFFSDGNPYVQEIFIKNNIEFRGLETGGSVANSAFTLARILGVTTIILVGQDLAITGNKTHADGTFKEKMEEIDTSSGNYLEVEGIDGNPIITRKDFKLYLDWFEMVIKAYGETVRVIDATEGGAKIHGTEIMSLKDAIEGECQKEVKVSERIEDILPLFTEEQRKSAWEYIRKTPDKLLDVRRAAKSGLKHYKRLKSICEKDKIDSKEYVKLIRKIKKTSDFFENNSTASLVLSAMKNLDLALRENIYNTEEGVHKEGTMIAKQGIFMCESIIKYVDVIKELSEEILKEDTDEQ